MGIEPGVLPEDRVQEAVIFQVACIDLTGSLHHSDGKKVWIALYTCAVYHAVYLEIVISLSTECFIQFLRKLIARRGIDYVIIMITEIILSAPAEFSQVQSGTPSA